MKGQLVGLFDHEEVYYNPITNIVFCKDIAVYLKSLISFQESDSIRANLDSKTSIIKTDKGYKIGCLEDSKFIFNQLITKAKQINNEYKAI